MVARDLVEETSRVVDLDARHVLEDDRAAEGNRQEPESRGTRLKRHRHETERHAGRGDRVERPRRLALVEADGPENAVVQVVGVRRHHLVVAGGGGVASAKEVANRPADDRKRRVEDRHAHRQQRHADRDEERVRRLRDERQDRHREADVHRAAVPEKDARRIVVVAEKAGKPAREGEVEERLLGIADDEERPGHAQGRDERDARRQAVEAVDQVEGVDRARDPEHRQQAVDPGRQLRPEPAEPESRPAPRERRRHELPEELRLGRQAPLVVRIAKRDDTAGDGDEPPVNLRRDAVGLNRRTARAEREDRIGEDDAQEKRQTAAARNRHRVDAARIGLVHHADAAVELADERRQHERQEKRPAEGDQVVDGFRGQRLDHRINPLRDSSAAASRLSSASFSITVTIAQRSARLKTHRSQTSRQMRATCESVR